ncbi:MAG: glycosyltransferase [Mesorhizobium sp.]|uniref:glycosyltransferase family 25 protein n=2 Tax=unclassified Mesorhizobium TaxID=325217 RepID=UPI000F7516AE|nr:MULTISPECIES: glycosyltransferase family 25 protein [unclassified Mesorhizobium]AZO02026.1 glycosyltransferase [Mesorhizobium sp. M2A.F.Ca.ET.043.02.1.1]RUW41676.1 glycosyltransferase [Mesorhizobium sp. M2A.F.Ca.ET.015.02.1.1]RUW75180.1 glycosyltransferase [Mesorhizobium sp. M2A.F.Ca.ET.067.02.1.1]RVC92038.1 glycosyltransferase [Mesorhizobium sp. M2A.F.Ca.ET.017.03.2.1]RVD11962.1 glycosyltransferase [Mesorhizobium sp. M2A.F.Ca.ET.029.05.1.1]
MSTIGLCMIVKNEAKVILQCLASALPLVDYVLIVDTGSTDGTQDLIRGFLAQNNVQGAVIDEPWREFAYNRSFALERLREVQTVDYAMIIDADDTLILDRDFEPAVFKSRMEHDLYDVEVSHGNISFYRPQICRNRLPFSFKGVLHEYLEAPPGPITRQNAEGFRIATGRGGARSQNPRKYQDDAAVLENVLATETDPFLISRYTFYLAQSYRDFGEREKALEQYLKRAELGFWNEEVYVSLLEAGNLMAALGKPFEEVVAVYERATQTVPARAEALHAASLYCRSQGRNAQGQEFARRGLDLTEPTGLFVQPWVYDYGLLDEFSINAYWAGAYRESLDACLKLLASDKLPPDMLKRVVANARFATEKLEVREPPVLGRLGAESLVEQHALIAQRSLRSRLEVVPRVLVAILAKQKEPALPLYLACIESLDYPRESIVLYIRTNNNTDKTEQILREWLERVGHLYAAVELDTSDVNDRVEQFREHEWNETRFKVLGRIRNISLRKTLEHNCDFYFVVDVDNFVRPATLRELVALDLPIVAPLLRSISPGQYYSNYHAEVDANGYYQHCDQYGWVLNRHVRGVIEMPLVHCTYLVRADVLTELTYDDGTSRYEYVVFADSARRAGIVQYIDNRQVYGYITFGDHEYHVSGGIERARELLRDAGDVPQLLGATASAPAPFLARPELPDSLKIHLINLDRSVDRWNRYQSHNWHLMHNTARISAVDGTSLDRAALMEEGLITGDCRYPPGTLGCALSHIDLWKRAVSENRTITVFEDDVRASFRFIEESAEIMSRAPTGWDMIQWGYIIDPSFLWLDFGLSKAKLEFYDRRYTNRTALFQSDKFPRSLIRIEHSFGLQAYTITPRGARILLEKCLPLRHRLIPFPGTDVIIEDTGIDCAMCAAYGSMQGYICMPPLVIVDDEQFSDRLATDKK